MHLYQLTVMSEDGGDCGVPVPTIPWVGAGCFFLHFCPHSFQSRLNLAALLVCRRQEWFGGMGSEVESAARCRYMTGLPPGEFEVAVDSVGDTQGTH